MKVMRVFFVDVFETKEWCRKMNAWNIIYNIKYVYIIYIYIHKNMASQKYESPFSFGGLVFSAPLSVFRRLEPTKRTVSASAELRHLPPLSRPGHQPRKGPKCCRHDSQPTQPVRAGRCLQKDIGTFGKFQGHPTEIFCAIVIYSLYIYCRIPLDGVGSYFRKNTNDNLGYGYF